MEKRTKCLAEACMHIRRKLTELHNVIAMDVMRLTTPDTPYTNNLNVVNSLRSQYLKVKDIIEDVDNLHDVYIKPLRR